MQTKLIGIEDISQSIERFKNKSMQWLDLENLFFVQVLKLSQNLSPEYQHKVSSFIIKYIPFSKRAISEQLRNTLLQLLMTLKNQKNYEAFATVYPAVHDFFITTVDNHMLAEVSDIGLELFSGAFDSKYRFLVGDIKRDNKGAKSMIGLAEDLKAGKFAENPRNQQDIINQQTLENMSDGLLDLNSRLQKEVADKITISADDFK